MDNKINVCGLNITVNEYGFIYAGELYTGISNFADEGLYSGREKYYCLLSKGDGVYTKVEFRTEDEAEECVDKIRELLRKASIKYSKIYMNCNHYEILQTASYGRPNNEVIIYDRDRVFKISAKGICYNDKIYKNIYEDEDIITKKYYCLLEPENDVFNILIPFDNEENASFFEWIVNIIIENIRKI